MITGKTRAVIFLLALTLASAVAGKGAKWRWQHPTPTGATLNDITSAARGSAFWAVGKAGTIIASRDSGRTWAVQESPRLADLNAVSAVDAERAWAVGDSGVILATRDGGERWRVQPTGVLVDLSGIAMVDARVGWAVGAGGVILVTRDGGGTWRPQHSRHGTFIDAIAAFSRKRAFAVGWRSGTAHFDALILKTEDGGVTWTERQFGPAFRFTAIRADRATGNLWVVGRPEAPNSPPLIMNSSDDGASWKPHKIDVSGVLHDVTVNGEVVTAIGISEVGRAWVTQSRDGGATWTSVSYPVGAALFGVAGAASDRLIAVGDGGTLLGPANIGFRMPMSLTRSNLTAIAFTNVRRGCAVGEDGLILCTNDSGAHWFVPRHLLPAGYRAVVWTSRDVAYAVADGGIIMRTLNGGKSWDLRSSPAEIDLTGIAARGNTVYAVGLDGFVMKSDNRGNTWSVVKKPAAESLVAVGISPRNDAFVLSKSGKLWKMAEGATSWQMVRTRLSGEAKALSLPGPHTIIIAETTRGDAPEEVLLRSDDGGRQWDSIPVPLSVEDMYFTSPDEGVLVGARAILTTKDGGRTWARTDIPTSATFRGIAAKGGFVWVAGDYATIIRLSP